MVLRIDSPHTEGRLAEGLIPASDIAAHHLLRIGGSSAGSALDDRPRRHPDPTVRSRSDTDAWPNRLRRMGWSVESRDCYRLARLEHRQILVFNDGRIVFKDPTIRGRHQYDGEWLKVTAFLWPDLGF